MKSIDGIAIETRVLDFVRPVRFWAEGLAYRRSGRVKQLESLRGRYAGKPLLVVGNGPSLNQTPLDEFVDIASIGMNKINLLFPRVAWRPSIIVCSNALVMKQNQEFFSTTQIPVFLNWNNRWFVSRSKRSSVDFFRVQASKEFSEDIRRGVGMGGTVTYVALQFAYFVGASPVVLFGIDHTFAEKGPANKVVRSKATDVNHFDPNYFGAGTLWQLPDLNESERAYVRAKEAFERDHRVIYDATVSGRLRIFPRIGIKEAKALCGLVGSRGGDGINGGERRRCHGQ